MILFGLILERILNAYLLLIILYAMMSWVPNLHNSSFRRFIASLVEPYLDIFRNKFFVIGIMDFSAMAGILVLYMAIEGIKIIT
jgi:YggT family protein